MNTHPVSIIIPVYATTHDQTSWLEKCIEQCIPQSDDIVVVVDGGIEPVANPSMYGTAVRFVSIEHSGKSIARNIGVEHAKYDLILPVDADDYPADNALDVLMSHWDGSTPLYCDLYKLHGDVAQPYPLLPFDCSIILDKCVASVFVLHTKEQWKSVGGWNSELNLYEDWEYNSRLFWTYGARKISAYLYYYRQHSLQSTVTASDEPTVRYRVKNIINNFARRNMMGCCGKKRTVSPNTLRQNAPFTQSLSSPNGRVQSVDLSLEADMNSLGDPGPGNVWAKYLGARGMGPHSRRGLRSHKKYKRIAYGQTRAVRQEDTVTQEQFEQGMPNCGLVLLRNAAVHAPPAPQPVVVQNNPLPAVVEERKPVEKVERKPVTSEELEDAKLDLVDMSIRDLKDYLADVVDPNEITLLLTAEQQSEHPRRGAIKLLKKTLDRMTSSKE